MALQWHRDSLKVSCKPGIAAGRCSGDAFFRSCVSRTCIPDEQKRESSASRGVLLAQAVLPAFTGVVAAAGYLGVATWVLSFQGMATNPNHVIKAALMVVVGAVAGLVALRLRAKFRRAVEEAVSRERVTNLFGQHVSPAVVDRLLDNPSEFTGGIREICVMFLDIRNFTENARDRPPEAVVEFLNSTFAFMIEAIDRHGGFINKFLGDGFLAIFGAPLDDLADAGHAVEAAREILTEIDERGLSHGSWPLKVGIGLHVGSAVTGNVGSLRRKEFTAIGDTVNLASRLEQLTKEYPARLIFSDSMMAALGATAGAARPLGKVAAVRRQFRPFVE
jgi:adenylate cyclase